MDRLPAPIACVVPLKVIEPLATPLLRHEHERQDRRS
jgi:hypothetical protein